MEYESGEVGGVSTAFSFANADLDGDIDILTSNGDLWWYENNRAGSYFDYPARAV